MQGSAAGLEVLRQRAVLKRNDFGAELLRVLWRLSFFELAVPPAGARILRLSHGAVHAAAGGHDGGVCAMVGAAGRKPRPAAFAAGCWRGISHQHCDSDWAESTDIGGVAPGSVR